MSWKFPCIFCLLTGGAVLAIAEMVFSGSPFLRLYGLACVGGAVALGLIAWVRAWQQSHHRHPPRRLNALRALVEALAERDWYARYLALTVIAELGVEARQVAPGVQECLGDEHEWVREAARKALESIAPDLLVESDDTVAV